jgi:uncharacterized protein
VAGKIFWPAGLITAAATIIGGYGGASVALRLRPSWIRFFVIGIGVLMTIYFFFRK